MIHKPSSQWVLACAIALLCATSSVCQAALFGFAPFNDALWGNLSSSLAAAFSPVDLMFIAMLVHARRCGVLR